MSDFKYKDFEYKDWTYDDYAESEQVKKYQSNLENHNALKPADYQSKYMGLADEVMNNYLNREDFSYDLNGDALYQQYKDKYVTQGKMAMQDTMAQAAAMTGGYGNSYAANVGNQAYQASLQNLNDIVPELYQMAYSKYQQEGQNMLNQYGMLVDRDNIDYGRYRDTVSDWNAERDYLTNLYNAERTYDYTKYSDNRNFDYGVYSDDRTLAQTQYNADRSLAYDEHRNAIADEQWNKTFQQALDAFNYQQERDRIADEQWQKNYDLQSDLSSYQNTISSLNSQISEMISPDDIEVDDNGNITAVKGYSVGSTPSSNANSNVYTGASISGFKTNTNDNFTVSVKGKNYSVENKGKVTNTKITNALDKQGGSNGDILIYSGEAYYKYKGTYYKLGAVGFIGKGDYSKLLSALKG